MNLNTPQKICVAFLVFLCSFWIALFIHGSKTGFYNYLYSFSFGLMPLVGGAVAMTKSRLLGEFKSAARKAVFFIGLGIFCWGCGTVVWSYYNFFLHIPVPYPSLADIGYAPSIFFYGLGAMYLAKATGVTLAFKNTTAKIFGVVTSFVVLILSYYILVVIARDGTLVSQGKAPFKFIFDIAYPLGDFTSLMISIVVSGLAFRYLKGTRKLNTIAVLLGLAVMFIGDSIFSYTTTTDTFYNGSPGDLILTIGLFLLTFGVLGFYDSDPNRLSSSGLNIHGGNVVITSAADDFALVVKNRQLAEALRKAFNALRRKFNKGVINAQPAQQYD